MKGEADISIQVSKRFFVLADVCDRLMKLVRNDLANRSEDTTF